jgi:hypothetical protein
MAGLKPAFFFLAGISPRFEMLSNTNYPCQSLTRHYQSLTRHYQMDLPGPLLSLCAHGNARFRLPTPGQRSGGPKAIPISRLHV